MKTRCIPVQGSSAKRKNSDKDGTTLDTDELFGLAGSLGRLWKQHRRRLLPNGIRDIFADLLLALRYELVPSGELSAFANLNRSRSDVGGLAELLKAVAARPRSIDNMAMNMSLETCTTTTARTCLRLTHRTTYQWLPSPTLWCAAPFATRVVWWTRA